MGKRKHEPLDEVIGCLGREDTRIAGNISDAYMESVRQSALHYLREHRDRLDAAEAADMGLAEVGAIIRRQRERIAFLEKENASTSKMLYSALTEKESLARELENMGAL